MSTAVGFCTAIVCLYDFCVMINNGKTKKKTDWESIKFLNKRISYLETSLRSEIYRLDSYIIAFCFVLFTFATKRWQCNQVKWPDRLFFFWSLMILFIWELPYSIWKKNGINTKRFFFKCYSITPKMKRPCHNLQMLSILSGNQLKTKKKRGNSIFFMKFCNKFNYDLPSPTGSL